MGDTFHLRIKKEYAAAMIEQLKKDDAIEIIEDAISDIPEWQKEAVRKTLAQVQQNPAVLQPWDVIKQKYKRPT
jgi:hypothetical protein